MNELIIKLDETNEWIMSSRFPPQNFVPIPRAGDKIALLGIFFEVLDKTTYTFSNDGSFTVVLRVKNYA